MSEGYAHAPKTLSRWGGGGGVSGLPPPWSDQSPVLAIDQSHAFPPNCPATTSDTRGSSKYSINRMHFTFNELYTWDVLN